MQGRFYTVVRWGAVQRTMARRRLEEIDRRAPEIEMVQVRIFHTNVTCATNGRLLRLHCGRNF